jgi:hypothetical protein
VRAFHSRTCEPPAPFTGGGRGRKPPVQGVWWRSGRAPPVTAPPLQVLPGHGQLGRAGCRGDPAWRVAGSQPPHLRIHAEPLAAHQLAHRAGGQDCQAAPAAQQPVGHDLPGRCEAGSGPMRHLPSTSARTCPYAGRVCNPHACISFPPLSPDHCPDAETPEGQACGLVKNLALMTYISVGCASNPVLDFLQVRLPFLCRAAPTLEPCRHQRVLRHGPWSPFHASCGCMPPFPAGVGHRGSGGDLALRHPQGHQDLCERCGKIVRRWLWSAGPAAPARPSTLPCSSYVRRLALPPFMPALVSERRRVGGHPPRPPDAGGDAARDAAPGGHQHRGRRRARHTPAGECV